MSAPDETGEIRCPVCDRSPLLATYGFDKRGRLFIHVKVYKGEFVKADVYIHEGLVTLKCYRCMKHNRVRMVERRPVLERTSRPDLQDAPPVG